MNGVPVVDILDYVVDVAGHIVENQLKDKKIVLFHAASAGEYEQLKPILKEVDRAKYFVLLTFFPPPFLKKRIIQDWQMLFVIILLIYHGQ